MLSKFDRNALIDEGYSKGKQDGRNETLQTAVSFLNNAGINPELITQFKNYLLDASPQ